MRTAHKKLNCIKFYCTRPDIYLIINLNKLISCQFIYLTAIVARYTISCCQFIYMKFNMVKLWVFWFCLVNDNNRFGITLYFIFFSYYDVTKKYSHGIFIAIRNFKL